MWRNIKAIWRPQLRSKKDKVQFHKNHTVLHYSGAGTVLTPGDPWKISEGQRNLCSDKGHVDICNVIHGPYKMIHLKISLLWIY